jgi:hypothetical protein
MTLGTTEVVDNAVLKGSISHSCQNHLWPDALPQHQMCINESAASRRLHARPIFDEFPIIAWSLVSADRKRNRPHHHRSQSNSTTMASALIPLLLIMYILVSLINKFGKDLLIEVVYPYLILF